MRRAHEDQMAQAAARRLDLLRRELGFDQAADESAGDRVDFSTGELLPPSHGPVRPVGRHARPGVGAGQRCTGWIQDRLPDRFRDRVRVGPREVALVAVLAALALATGAVVVLRSGVSTDAVPVAAPTSQTSLLTPAADPVSPPTASADPSGLPGATTSQGRGVVLVDVAGRVRHPGVIQLPAGSRVIDALRKAGGARPHVDLTLLNLARVLADGEQILVGRPGPAQGGLAGAAASAQSSAAVPGSLVNLNGASEEQLETLPGVGPVTAQKILDWRQAHGRFSSVDELLEISGIGDKTLARLAPFLTL